MKHNPGFQKLVEETKARVKETNSQDVKQRMEKGEKLNLIDVREESEWNKGHLPGARHIGKGVIERDIETAIPDKNAEIILYCGGGFRSALSADNLQKLVYKKVVSMDGGWRDWTERGYPVE